MSEERRESKPSHKQGALGRAVGLASELGLAMGLMSALIVGSCLALGRWLDRLLASSPVLTIVLLVAGALAGQAVLLRMALSATTQIGEGARHAVDRSSLRRSFGMALRFLLLGVLPPLVGAVLGMALDRSLGTSILATVVLAVVGLAAGTVLLLRLVRSQAHASQGD